MDACLGWATPGRLLECAWARPKGEEFIVAMLFINNRRVVTTMIAPGDRCVVVVIVCLGGEVDLDEGDTKYRDRIHALRGEAWLWNFDLSRLHGRQISRLWKNLKVVKVKVKRRSQEIGKVKMRIHKCKSLSDFRDSISACESSLFPLRGLFIPNECDLSTQRL